VARFVLPHQDIKVAGGREKNLRDLQSWMFYAGATSTLVGNYLATYGRPAVEDLQMIRDLELEWRQDVGGPNPQAVAEPDPSQNAPRWRFPRLPVVQV
jgi:biotin synthase-like enzyme